MKKFDYQIFKEKSKFQLWYSKNRSKFNAQRRSNYSTDPAYRELQRKYVRDYRARLKEKKSSYRIGELAKFCERTVQAIKVWETNGLFPCTKGYNSYRVYTRNQMVLVKGIAESIDLNNPEMLKYSIEALNELWND